LIGRMDEGEQPKAEDRKQKERAKMDAAVIPVLMPQAGNSMEEGTIVKWRVKEGDRITKGQVIFEVETDKATMEVEATDGGRVAKIVVGEGGVQKVKEPVAYLSEGDVDLAAEPQKELPQKAQKAQGQMAVSSSAPPVLSVASLPSGMVNASPAAKKIAREKGLDLASVGTGSGPGGRILSTDLARASNANMVAASGGIVRRKMTKMRKAIAANLTLSKQTVPHFYLRATINADAMMAFYRAEKAKYPCTVNDVITLACAKAIMEFPAFRSKLDGDEVVEYPAANIGVAVGVDDGLTVPVLISAQAMTLQQIGQNTKRIAENARAGKLEGYGQGNFTISNLGMFGVEEFAAIVNPPEPAILAVGAVREAVIVKDVAMKAGRVMTITLSCDHRIIDGLLAAKFMGRLKELLENPETMQNAK
jgi:pyruvate dehydrogenase E2 component (dihydrolipoamide acetyltransferase)